MRRIIISSGNIGSSSRNSSNRWSSNKRTATSYISAIFWQFMGVHGSPISLPISFISWHLALFPGSFSPKSISSIILHLMVAQGGPSLLISANFWHLMSVDDSHSHLPTSAISLQLAAANGSPPYFPYPPISGTSWKLKATTRLPQFLPISST
jgi:hypothetical protein